MNYLTEKNWIEKSKTLIYAEWSKFDINELQIFETYLSRINPRDEESSCVRFTRKEYAEMMGYADGRNLKTKTLNKWVKSFINKQISIAYEGGVRHFNLFSDADVSTDAETGEVVIDLDCNHKLKPVFFNIAEQGYIKYRRHNTIEFKSEYTMKLYSILKDYAWGKYEWEVGLERLKETLGATEPLYDSFAEFNRRILKRAEKEINGNTDISFTYEKLTVGRKVKGIKFKIKDYKKDKNIELIEESMPGQITIDEVLDEEEDFSFNQQRDKRIIENMRPIVEDVNYMWDISDEQLLEINEMIFNWLLENRPDLFEFGKDPSVIDDAKNDKFRKVLLRARSGQAKNLYKFLIAAWDDMVK